MSSVVTPHYSNNILSCGYIREYENEYTLLIPSGVQTIVAMYCRQDIVYGIGCNDYLCSFDINSNKSSYHQIQCNLINHEIINGYGININSIYSELYKDQHVNKEQIQLLSTSTLLKSTDLYLYTINNNLYKYQRNINVSNTTSTSVPVSLAKIDPFTNDIITDIKSGLHHTLFLTKSGNVYSYGLNDVGQCGFNKDKFINITSPKLMATNIRAIACGSFHNLLINNNDELIVCGYNYCGQLGVTHDLANLHSSDSGDSFTSNISNHTISIQYEQDQYVEFEMIDTSDSDDIDDDGFAFQDDSDDESSQSGTNQLSMSQVRTNNVPIKNVLAIDIPTKNKFFMDLGLKIKHIDCGKFHSLVITKDGKCFTFGSNAFGNLGNGEESEWGATNPIPHQIQIQIKTEHESETESIIDGSCGENHNLLLTKSNKIIAFGDNSNHQCSMINKNKLLSPIVISKEKELNLAANIYIESVICSKNESLIFIDPYSRINST